MTVWNKRSIQQRRGQVRCTEVGFIADIVILILKLIGLMNTNLIVLYVAELLERRNQRFTVIILLDGVTENWNSKEVINTDVLGDVINVPRLRYYLHQNNRN